MKKTDIVVPCFNEADVLEMFYEKTKEITDAIEGYDFTFIFVNDGSRDGTERIIKRLAAADPKVKFVSFSRNFGKEAAIYAGLKFSGGEYVIVMDADLQHPPDVIREMTSGIDEGYESCAAMRIGASSDSAVRTRLSEWFYKISNRLTDVELESGMVDFRMMSRKMVDSVLALSEVQRFSKGIFEWVGFKTKRIPYEHAPRPVGKSKWSFKTLFKYAVDGITSFSIAPLRMVSIMGFVICVLALIYILITLIQTLIVGISVPGYVTTLCAVLFMGGILELSIGVLGEYIGHIYMESKKRPLFILKETNIIPEGKKEDE